MPAENQQPAQTTEQAQGSIFDKILTYSDAIIGKDGIKTSVGITPEAQKFFLGFVVFIVVMLLIYQVFKKIINKT